MPEKWTGRLIGVMHNNCITYEQVANKLGVNKAYISMILNSRRKPNGIQERLEGAVQELIDQRRRAVQEATANKPEEEKRAQ